ncbi:MAG: SRPBCC domain-containing protein [Rhodobacteraceae bacterium]|nr:SRPBCC domain-containing protein [Paracoccaceae bacterium]
MTKMTDMKIVKTLLLKAQPGHVWRFLTEPDRLAEWFHRGGGPMAPGGDYTLLTNSLGKEGEKICWGKVITLDPPHRLVHSFTHQGLQGVETTVSWTLTSVEGGTVLTLIHEGWSKVPNDAFGVAASHDVGWDEHFIRLRRVTE